MQVEGMSYELGSKVVTNNEVLKMVKEESEGFHMKDLDAVLDQVNFYFNHSGIKTRHWMDEEQTPLNMVLRAIDNALEKADCSMNDIDLIIHCGVGRGFSEPGQAHIVAHYMGLSNVKCFDVMDACNSWIQSLFLSYNLLKTGSVDKVLVINTECAMVDGGFVYPYSFQIDSMESLQYKFPGLTCGDGVTATVLGKDDKEWVFKTRAMKDKAHLCTIPHSSYEQYSSSSDVDYLGVNGMGFASFARELSKIYDSGEIHNTLLDLGEPLDSFELIFTHGHARKPWEKCLAELGGNIDQIKWNTFNEIGNLASASIPTSMCLAEEEGDLHPGDHIALWMASAGATFSAVDLVY
ncbi:MAG: hypothetical protein GY754_04360 [bacterium]|nr:hypothetical protein [bacterium]